MGPDETYGGTTECVRADVLIAYSVGKLPAGEFESVAAHLAGCSRCESLLENSNALDDSLVTTLRRHLGGQPPIESTARDSRTVMDTRRGQRLAMPRRWGQHDPLEEVGPGGMGGGCEAAQRRGD